jgi:hypothetical protein
MRKIAGVCRGRVSAALVLGLACGELTFGGAPTALDAAPENDVVGIWQVSHYSSHLMPMDGGTIPFTSDGLALYRAIQTQRRHNADIDSAESRCLPQGVPRSLTAPYPFEILESAGQVLFLHEVNRQFRIVLLQSKHNDPDIWDPSYMGDGIAQWDHGTLEVDTTNFDAGTWLDDSGLPHSEQLHIVERLRGLNSKELEDVISVEDPKMFTRVWRARLTFDRKPQLRLATDWVCGEAHREISAVAGAVPYR